MVDFFIRRPIFATVCALIIILAGAVSIPSLPVEQYPRLAPPTISVSAVYNGASAQEVESAVTIPLEEAINGAQGLKYISSSSTNTGAVTISAVFDVSRNLDLAAVDVQNRISSVEGELPASVIANGLTVTKAASGFVLAAGFFSPTQTYDNLFISNYISIYVVDAIKRVPGVADVIIFGQRTYAMRVWLNPLKLAKYSLTAADVLSALQQQNVQIAAGAVGQPPAPPGQAYQFSVRVSGQLASPRQFDAVVLKTAPGGGLVRLRDVGHAQLGAQDYSSHLEYNGHQVIGLAVEQLSSANALAVDTGVRNELRKLSRQFPSGLVYKIAFDNTIPVRESIKDVLITLAEAIGLVILVIFLFLQDWRTTLIPAVTIPVSLIGTFAFIKLFGFSINTLTLFALVLATGLVVDDAIVVIENVERHISSGESEPHHATANAMREITSAVIATSLVLISVFVPVALFPGTTGIMFRQFGVTIAFSIAISAFNALTLTPALSALLLRQVRAKAGIWRIMEAGIHGLTRIYGHILHWAARWRWAMALIFIAVLGLTYFVFQRVPSAFVPPEDQGMIMILVQAPPGASLGYTSGILHQVLAVVDRQPEVEGGFAVAGFSLAGGGSNSGMAFIQLKPYGQRVGPQNSAQALVARLRGPLFMIPGAMVQAFLPPTIRGLGNFGGFQFEVLDKSGASEQKLYQATQALVRAGNANPGLTSLFSSFTANDPQIEVTIDRNRAQNLQVPFSQITDALQAFMGSVYINNFTFNHRAYRVYAQADPQFRNNPGDMRQYYVRSNTGQMIRLSSLVRMNLTSAPATINHYDLFRSAEIDGSAAPGYSSGQAIATMQQLAAKVLPRGMSYDWTGLSLEEIQSGSKTLILFLLGFLVVFLTLAAQYESWVLPFIVMLAVPAALLGALAAQALRGYYDDIYCQIGLVMLIGLASKNSILIVEFAEQLRERGRTLLEATLESARIRLRPILMTSVAFMLGIVPLMLASGAGAAARHSVGTAVFGGMLAATTLNLVFIPVLYLIVRSVFPGKPRHAADSGANIPPEPLSPGE